MAPCHRLDLRPGLPLSFFLAAAFFAALAFLAGARVAMGCFLRSVAGQTPLPESCPDLSMAAGAAAVERVRVPA